MGGIPEKSTPPLPPGPTSFARESPAVPRGGAEARSVHLVRGGKREVDSPPGGIMGDRPPESALLPVGEGVGAGERRERRWVGRLRELRGTDRPNPLGRVCGGLGGEWREGNPFAG